MSTFTSARVKRTDVDKAQEIAKYVTQHGWASVGGSTEERASISSVIAVAIDALYQRMKKEETS